MNLNSELKVVFAIQPFTLMVFDILYSKSRFFIFKKKKKKQKQTNKQTNKNKKTKQKQKQPKNNTPTLQTFILPCVLVKI